MRDILVSFDEASMEISVFYSNRLACCDFGVVSSCPGTQGLGCVVPGLMIWVPSRREMRACSQ